MVMARGQSSSFEMFTDKVFELQNTIGFILLTIIVNGRNYIQQWGAFSEGLPWASYH